MALNDYELTMIGSLTMIDHLPLIVSLINPIHLHHMVSIITISSVTS